MSKFGAPGVPTASTSPTFPGPGVSVSVSTVPASGWPKMAIKQSTVIEPTGALDRWRAYRNSQSATVQGDVIIYGDSTTYGSGANYSWLQRLRDRSVAAGYADGGKGLFAGAESAIVYDSPEVNGYVTGTWTGNVTGDLLNGGFFGDDGTVAGRTITLQFIATGFRLWLMGGGSVTYTIDGGSAVAFDATTATGGRFVKVTGLTNALHTLVVTNAHSGYSRIALAPTNGTGITYNKWARSGLTFQGIFFVGTPTSPYTQAYGESFLEPMGLAYTSGVSTPYANFMSVDASYAAGDRINPVLAMTDLGFNDLGTVGAGTDPALWTEYVKRFAAACQVANVDGVVLSGQLPYSANWPTYGADCFIASRDAALSEGLAFVDMFYPIGGPSLTVSGGSGNPHLTKAGYQAQADFLWDNLLGL